MRGLAIFVILAGASMPAFVYAQDESVVVYGPASSDIGIARSKIASTVQTLDADELNRFKTGTMLDSLGTLVPGVNLNDAQGNDFFRDVRYRGFAASPLQGTAQGIAVYQNGIRLNEAFGDTVNWELIPENAISYLDVWTSNPVFGLNALGGAINITMKDGFTFKGASLEAQGGSFGQAMGSLEFGVQEGNASIYLAVDGVTDGGWRPRSGADLVRVYADGGYRFGSSELRILASGAVSSLGVIGPTPVDLLDHVGDNTIYTSPQTTLNRMGSLALTGKSTLADHWQVSGTAYVRTLRQRHVDGNDSEFVQCSGASSYPDYLCLDDEGFPRPDPFTGPAVQVFYDQFVMVGPDGQPVVPFSDDFVYGTIDRTSTDATSLGASLQLSSDQALFGLENYFTFGLTIDHSAIAFAANSMLGDINQELVVMLDPNMPGSGTVLHTAGSTGIAPASLRGQNNYYGVYLVDALSLTPALTLTGGVRFNVADINSLDRTGSAPELTGSHGFGRANPLVGLNWDTGLGINLFGGFSQSSRAPTPLELDCADPDRPCLLENSLAGDPPLKQVAANTYEAGLRIPGKDFWGGALSLELGYFHTDIENDIFALASTILGRGYFANVPATAREGLDGALRYSRLSWSAYVNYSYLRATYEFSGTIASPNNPQADDDGNVMVSAGRTIPLNPAHRLHFGFDATVLDGWDVGADAGFTGSQYFEGDQSNVNAKLPSYWTVNLRSSYQLFENFQVYGQVNNLFNSRKATYGTYFEAGAVESLLPVPVSDPRTLTLLRPQTILMGIRFTF